MPATLRHLLSQLNWPRWRLGKTLLCARSARHWAGRLGEALKDPALDNAALTSTASLVGVPHGSYLVKLLVGGENSAATRCDPRLLFVVK